MSSTTLPVNAASCRGFSLVELAIVLVIVSLLAGGLMMTLSSQLDLRNNQDTRQKLKEVQEALLGYAATHIATDGHPFLPCPDTNNDGAEDRTGSACNATATNAEGTLPWRDLGLAREDAWGNRFRYRVDKHFSDSNIGIAINTPAATLRICDQTPCATFVATQIPVVILSHGTNGFGAINSGGAATQTPTSADELENSNSNDDFVSRTPTSAGANEFDDLVIWLSPNILYNRLIAAGRLP